MGNSGLTAAVVVAGVGAVASLLVGLNWPYASYVQAVITLLASTVTAFIQSRSDKAVLREQVSLREAAEGAREAAEKAREVAEDHLVEFRQFVAEHNPDVAH